MRINKYFIISIIFIFSLISVSANGLIIQGDNPILLNKTYGIDTVFNITIKNTEPIDFYNITFEDNTKVQMFKIPKLLSGQNITTEVRLVSDDITIDNLRIKGVYESNLGALNETYVIDVNSGGFNTCPNQLIKGDKVKWINHNLYPITIRNSKTFEDISVIGSGLDFTLTLNNIEKFSFYGLYSGFIFTSTCEINILGTEGLINNPNYDAILSIISNVKYPDTSLLVNIPNLDYTLNFADSDEGIIVITNNGSEVAHINILGNDFLSSLTPNNFNLDVGKSKTISYTISSTGNIFKTNQTDKTYFENITIFGNFQNITRTFNIYINKAILGNSTSQFDYADILAYVKYCRENPDDKICPKKETVYIFTNKSNNKFNTTLTEEQFRDLMIKSLVFYSSYEIDKQNTNEKIDDFNSSIVNLSSDLKNSISSTSQRDLNFEKFKDSQTFAAFTLFTILTAIGGFFFIREMKIKKRKKLEMRYY